MAIDIASAESALVPHGSAPVAEASLVQRLRSHRPNRPRLVWVRDTQRQIQDAIVNLGLALGIFTGLLFAELSWGPFWLGSAVGAGGLLAVCALILLCRSGRRVES
jgi:hypothetical protein